MTGWTRLGLYVSRCVGVGQCELLEPDLFRVDDDTGTATIVGEPELPSQRAEAIVDQCPSGAIQIDNNINPTLPKLPDTD